MQALDRQALQDRFRLEIDGCQYTGAPIWDVLLAASAEAQLIKGTTYEMEELRSGSRARRGLNRELLLAWEQAGETLMEVLERPLKQPGQLRAGIRRLLLDGGFPSPEVIRCLQVHHHGKSPAG